METNLECAFGKLNNSRTFLGLMPPYRNILFAFFPGESAREPRRGGAAAARAGFRLTTTHLAVDAAFHGREEVIVVVVVSGVVGGGGSVAAAVVLGGSARDIFETDETDERVPILIVHLVPRVFPFALK